MPTDFLQLGGKSILVTGVANRKSVAYHIARVLTDAGANVLYAVRSDDRKASLAKLLGDADIYVCDVEFEDQIDRLRKEVAERHPVLH